MRRLAATVTDHTSPAGLAALLPLALRLLDTAGTGEAVDVALAGWLATVAPDSRARRRLLRETTRWARLLTGTEPPSSSALVLTVAAADLHLPMLRAKSTRDSTRLQLLTDVCDHLDQLTGRAPTTTAPTGIPVPRQREHALTARD